MFRTGTFVVLGLMAAGCAGFVNVTQADTVNLVGGWNVNWNITANPTQSPSVPIQIQNAVASPDLIFNGYDLGLKFQLLSGGGSIALDAAANPSSNSIVPLWDEPSPRIGLNSGTMVLDNDAYDDSLDDAVPDVPTNLVTVNFMPGAIAPTPGSVFEVLSDCNWSDYYDHTGTIVNNYANNQTKDFELGTITVVPEPGSLALLGVAAVGIAICFARQKIRLRHARVICVTSAA